MREGFRQVKQGICCLSTLSRVEAVIAVGLRRVNSLGIAGRHKWDAAK